MRLQNSERRGIFADEVHVPRKMHVERAGSCPNLCFAAFNQTLDNASGPSLMIHFPWSTIITAIIASDNCKST